MWQVEPRGLAQYGGKARRVDLMFAYSTAICLICTFSFVVLVHMLVHTESTWADF